MADIEKISVGGTSYDVRDANTLRNLTSAQETQILQDGTYNGEDVDNGEVFTTEDGKFTQFEKEAQAGLQDVSQLFDGKNIYASSDKFFYVTSNSATYGYSTNGIYWSTGTLPRLQTGGNERVFFVNGNTLKIANCRYSNYNGYTFTSTDDGATWSSSQMNMRGQSGVGKGWYLSGGLYVMCSDIRTNTTLYYSTDAINWTYGVSGMPESDYGSCFCSDGTYLYLLGTSGKLYKTTDCVNWTEIGTSTEVATTTTCLEFYQGKFWIYKAMDGNGIDNIFSTLKYSTNGLTWTSVPTITTSITDGQTKSAFRLNYCGGNTAGQFVLCLRFLSTVSQNYSSSNYYYVSSNGVDWEEKTFDETYVAQYSSKYGTPTNFASTGSDFVIASATNKSYKGSATVNYTYSLTQLSYDKDEVDTLTTVDQTYDSTSTNAQSGVAINGAGFLKNTATGTGSLTILGAVASNTYSINIGSQSSTGSTSNSVALGYSATLGTNASNGIAIGYNSYVSGTGSIALGDSYGQSYGAKGSYSISVGYRAGTTGSNSIALGAYSHANASYAIQIGQGTNSTANTLSVGLSSSDNYTLLNSDGTIPMARMPSGLPKKETYTCPALTSVSGICTWTVTHTLGTQDVIATVYDTTTNKEIMFEGVHTDSSTYTINITSSTDIASGAYKVVIIG